MEKRIKVVKFDVPVEKGEHFYLEYKKSGPLDGNVWLLTLERIYIPELVAKALKVLRRMG
ncbi:hypothetical protein DRH14_04955 [Candidatus Shapirobacteria bacterium]|nr:MAG: hypothetical protein DRH14_04955 [Candidatus Shapirobacteria bacterium]